VGGSSIRVGVQRAMDLAACFPDLLRLKEDSGAKKIILARPHDVVSFDFPAGAIDIDTAADYKKLYQPLAADGTRLG